MTNMEITLIGFFLIPLGVILFLFKPSWLFYSFIFFIPFSASAVINIEIVTFGLQPGFYFAMLLIIRMAMDYLLGKGVRIPLQSKTAISFLVLFVVAAFLSLIMPVIIDGRTETFAGLVKGYIPIIFSKTNITTFLYLAFGVLLTLFIVFKIKSWEIFINSIKVFLVSAFIVSLWGLQQPILFYLGIPYPSFLFNQSISEAVVYDIALVGLSPRISSVSVEPSVFARYLLIAIAISCVLFIRKARIFNKNWILPFFLFVFLLALLLTLSTTAYAGLLFMITAIFTFYFVKRPKVSLRMILLTFLILIGISIIFYAVFGDKLLVLLESMKGQTVDKAHTFSGIERFIAGREAISLFAQYPVLGVGWGSVLSFDMFSKILSETGIIGFLCFFMFLIFAYKVFKMAIKISQPQQKIFVESLGISLLTLLFTNVIAGFDFVFLHLWFLLGLLLSLSKIISPQTKDRCSYNEI